MRDEVLTREEFDNLMEAGVIIAARIEQYNTSRPHRGLGILTPSQFAAGSKWPGSERDTLTKLEQSVLALCVWISPRSGVAGRMCQQLERINQPRSRSIEVSGAVIDNYTTGASGLDQRCNCGGLAVSPVLVEPARSQEE